MRILAERWVLTLALNDGDQPPYPTPLFYALAKPGSLGRHAAPLLLFASSATTHHGQLAGIGPTAAAAAVYLESETVQALRGAQLRGVLVREDAVDRATAQAARAVYVARHRVAEPALASGSHHLYVFIVTWAKLTDNRLQPSGSATPGRAEDQRSEHGRSPGGVKKFGKHPEVGFDADWPAGSLSAEVEQSRRE